MFSVSLVLDRLTQAHTKGYAPMARTKKPVIVVPASVKVADLLLQVGTLGGHTEVSKYVGLTYNTTVGKRILDARASLKDGFTVSFFNNLRVVANTISAESADVQALFDEILSTTAAAAETETLIADTKSVVVKPAEVKAVSHILNTFKK